MNYKKFIRKKLVYGSIVALLGVGALVVNAVERPVTLELTAEAVNLPAGNTEIGKIDNVPVIKANTNDMSSQSFQALIDSLVTESDAQYVVNTTFWGQNTQLVGGQPLSAMGTGQSYWLRADGFTMSDSYIQLAKNEVARIANVGSATDVTTNKKINLDLGIVYRDSVTSNASGTGDTVYLAAKSQNGVITLGWLAPADDGSSDGGGSSESGGGPGDQGDGTMASYINNVAFGMVLVNADTGQPLPDDQTMMALKLSDIDALQRATLGISGAKGIVVSPDTQLAIDGQGLVAAGTGAVNTDSKYLTPYSYITLRQFNTALTQYTYTGTELDKHCDIVIGAFGEYPFQLNLGGFIEVDKTTVQYGKNEWNNQYSFDPLIFDVMDASGKVVDSIEIDADGKGKSNRLPVGSYTLKEKASNWASTGQTVSADRTVTVKAGETTSVKPENTAVQGTISISKSLEGYGTTMPNGLYSLSGLQFKITSEDGKYTDTVTLNSEGKATSKKLPLGKYTVQEIASSVTKPTGQTVNKTVYTAELTYKDQNTEVVVDSAAVTNKPVLGEITVRKSGIESGTDLWNERYSLKGNVFEVVPVDPTDTKWVQGTFPLQITTDVEGLAKTPATLPLGKYKITEVNASAGFANTFKPVEVELTWANNTTEIVYNEVTGTNTEIKGQNTLEKEDIETGKEAQGKASMKNAEYALFYGDEATGSCPHDIGEPVKWTDIPKAKLLAGEKVTTSLINGIEVEHGDNVVINVDDEKLNVAIGNLALGKYEWREINAPEGYAPDKVGHTFEIAKKDDQTQTIITPDTLSKEQVIKAKLRIQKLVEIAGESAESGYNGIEFTVSPLEGTKGEPFVMTTGVNPANDEDGYAEAMLVYGDYVVKETKGIPGYEPIKDIYIHMETDEEKDLLTISASNYPDFSKPFSTRTFTLSDNANTDNPNGENTVGSVSSDQPTISLSKITFTDKASPEPPEEEAPQPHKFTVLGEKVDVTGTTLLDDDSELTDRYQDTNNDPYNDKVDNNEDYNLNTKVVQPGTTLNYQLWLDTTPYTKDSLLTKLEMIDDYDETLLDTDTKNVKVYDKTGKDVTNQFSITLKEGQLSVSANQFVEAENAKGKAVNVVNTEKLSYGQYYKIEFVTTVKQAIASSKTIVNVAKQLVVTADNQQWEQPTEKRVNTVQQESNPSKDVLKEDSGDSINGQEVALSSDFIYVLNSRQVEKNRSAAIHTWTIEDNYDERYDRFKGTFRVYAATDFASYKKGDLLPEDFFKAEDKDGCVRFIGQEALFTTINRVKNQAVAFSIHADFFRFAHTELVVNTFDEIVNDSNEQSNQVDTNTPAPQPHKFDLSKGKVDLLGEALLDDDKELKDRYKETNENPYADKADNNEKENNNTKLVQPGHTVFYQLWLDTTPFDQTSELTILSMVDDYDESMVTPNVKELRVYDNKGNDVTALFKVTDSEGKVTVAANAFTKAKNSKGEAVQVVDTKKIPLGQTYKIELPMTVKKEAKAGKDLVNMAKQTWNDREGGKKQTLTEKRVNKVEGKKAFDLLKPETYLPNTGDTPSGLFVKWIGWSILLGLAVWKRKDIQRAFRKIRLEISK